MWACTANTNGMRARAQAHATSSMETCTGRCKVSKLGGTWELQKINIFDWNSGSGVSRVWGLSLPLRRKLFQCMEWELPDQIKFPLRESQFLEGCSPSISENTTKLGKPERADSMHIYGRCATWGLVGQASESWFYACLLWVRHLGVIGAHLVPTWWQLGQFGKGGRGTLISCNYFKLHLKIMNNWTELTDWTELNWTVGFANL